MRWRIKNTYLLNPSGFLRNVYSLPYLLLHITLLSYYIVMQDSENSMSALFWKCIILISFVCISLHNEKKNVDYIMSWEKKTHFSLHLISSRFIRTLRRREWLIATVMWDVTNNLLCVHFVLHIFFAFIPIHCTLCFA